VTRCPECAQGFNLLRRKHHCRLCGSILCHDCSDFIPLPEAFEMIHSERQIREDTACASITFRTCVHCTRILRQEAVKSQRYRGGSSGSNTGDGPAEGNILSLYDDLRGKMSEIDKLLPQLVSVVESIRSGETLYSREEANALRSKLLRANEQIDVISKQVSGMKSETNAMIMLQQRIRQSCVAYIRDFIRSVPVVPDQSEDTSSTSSSLGGASNSLVMTGDGWSISAPDYQQQDDGGGAASGGRQSLENENPVQQQIRNVKFYIEQAKSAGKMDEVEMLETSLRDLILWQQSEQ
jgi:rabenosyn-5